MKNKVTVVGLGKLGLPLAITFALSNIEVGAMDINEVTIEKLKNHEAPFEETNLQESLLKENVKNNLKPTTSLSEAMSGSIATFILVNTPSKNDGSFGLKFLKSASESVAKELKKIKDYHVVVVVSTVSPTDCEDEIIPILENFSEKKCGKDFGFVHNPEFIALGSVINDMLHPDFRVIGEFDKRSGDIVEKIYQQVSDNIISRMSIVDAELVKIALNCYLTLKISFANTLGEISQRLKNSDANLVTKTLGLDKRISAKFLKPGLGYGGPCFPRDNVAFKAFAKKVGGQSYIPNAVVEVNNKQVDLAVKRVSNYKDIKDITVLGLSYKPDVPYITESQALEITKKLIDQSKYKITVYDPQAMPYAKKELFDKVIFANSLEDSISDDTDLVIILTPWKEFKNLDFPKKKVLDFWV